MKKKNVIIIILALAIIVVISGRRETIGNGEIAARTSIFGRISVYGPGEKTFIIPGIYPLLRFKADPVTITLTGDEAVVVKRQEVPVAVECQVTYRLNDPAALIRRFGKRPPGEKIKAEIRKIMTRELAAAAKGDGDFMATVPSRVLMTARLLESLSRELNPAGIQPENLNLRLQETEKKPA